ncbi:VUT family protein [Azospirillum brasilense]|uniref:VUT family protein n=1 Tax=Azospirillum brasilense TaxID=192 RepID=UPI001EDAA480|nr:VUT family protein [Azospirillum brasilense]UKJ75431.1 VUT family protein [Azospirillum brasilense]
MLSKSRAEAPGRLSARAEGFVYLAAFTACVPLANWMVGHVGTTCIPDGPCVLPVAPGIAAPSGVLIVGLALVLRDLVQRRLGAAWSIAAIVIGTLLSALLAPQNLIVASAVAFLLSELTDFAVYTPLLRRGLVLAVAISGLAGLLVDSVVFLQLAFGSLEYLPGQAIGKAWMIALALPMVAWLRRRDKQLGFKVA